MYNISFIDGDLSGELWAVDKDSLDSLLVTLLGQHYSSEEYSAVDLYRGTYRSGTMTVEVTLIDGARVRVTVDA